MHEGYHVLNEKSCQLNGADNIFIAGDVDGSRAILHESADDGAIAGFNACQDKVQQYKGELGNYILLPNIATVGKRYVELVNEKLILSMVKSVLKVRALQSSC